MIFNVGEPPLLISVRIDINELVRTLSMPCICHQALLLGLNLIIIITNNLLSFSLLIVISGQFPPICTWEKQDSS